MKRRHHIPCMALLGTMLLCIAIPSQCRAQAAATPKPGGSTVAEEEPERRDPFWPVGYSARATLMERERRAAEEAARRASNLIVNTDIPIEWPKLKEKGISRDSRGNYMAFVSGVGLVEEGRVVAITKKGLVYRIKITKIDETGIKTENLTVEPVEK